VNAPFRFAVVAFAAFLLSLIPNIVLAAPADQLAVRWSELPPVLEGRRISVHPTDGATVEGRYSSLQADALSIRVTKTSDPAQHPSDATRLARPELAQITVQRHRGWKGRIIGLITGGAIAALVAGWAAAISQNEGGSYAGIAAVAGGGALGINYLIGWGVDVLRTGKPVLYRIEAVP
jgi:hypothetical protein